MALKSTHYDTIKFYGSIGKGCMQILGDLGKKWILLFICLVTMSGCLAKKHVRVQLNLNTDVDAEIYLDAFVSKSISIGTSAGFSADHTHSAVNRYVIGGAITHWHDIAWVLPQGSKKNIKRALGAFERFYLQRHKINSHAATLYHNGTEVYWTLGWVTGLYFTHKSFFSGLESGIRITIPFANRVDIRRHESGMLSIMKFGISMGFGF